MDGFRTLPPQMWLNQDTDSTFLVGKAVPKLGRATPEAGKTIPVWKGHSQGWIDWWMGLGHLLHRCGLTKKLTAHSQGWKGHSRSERPFPKLDRPFQSLEGPILRLEKLFLVGKAIP